MDVCRSKCAILVGVPQNTYYTWIIIEIACTFVFLGLRHRVCRRLFMLICTALNCPGPCAVECPAVCPKITRCNVQWNWRYRAVDLELQQLCRSSVGLACAFGHQEIKSFFTYPPPPTDGWMLPRWRRLMFGPCSMQIASDLTNYNEGGP